MSTVISFPAARGKPVGQSLRARANRRADAPVEPVVVILPVVRIERHDVDEHEAARAFEPGPVNRKVL